MGKVFSYYIEKKIFLLSVFIAKTHKIMATWSFYAITRWTVVHNYVCEFPRKSLWDKVCIQGVQKGTKFFLQDEILEKYSLWNLLVHERVQLAHVAKSITKIMIKEEVGQQAFWMLFHVLGESPVVWYFMKKYAW